MKSTKVEVAVRCEVYMCWGIGFCGVVNANLVIVGNLVGYPNVQVSGETFVSSIAVQVEFSGANSVNLFEKLRLPHFFIKSYNATV